jgi:hypothetical protein
MIVVDFSHIEQQIRRDHEGGPGPCRAAAIWRPQAVDSVIPGRQRLAAPVTSNFTGALTAVHRDAPAFPQVAHSPVHKGVLTP